METKWISLFSQTGSEIKTLAEKLERFPDVILTNNMEYSGDMPNVQRMTAHEISNWLRNKENIPDGSIITTHGYLRIIPADVVTFLQDRCGTCIFNGHPAPITMYPELIGKDPQKRVYEGIVAGKYDTIGTVIHVMDTGVDTGTVVMGNRAKASDVEQSLEAVTEALHQLSGDLWLHFMTMALKEKNNGQDS